MYVLFDCNDPEKNYNNNMYECRGGSRISVKGFIYVYRWGFALLILSHFLIYPMKMKSETKLFHFHRIFKNS